MTRARLAAWGTALAGLLIATGLVVHAGLADIVALLAHAGLPLLLLLPFHALPLLLDAQGWRVLLAPLDPSRRASLPFLWWIATVREAVSRLLPSAGIGGEIVGIRLSRLRLSNTLAVTASVAVEVLLTVAAQYVFCALGVVLLMSAADRGDAAATVLAGLALSLPIPLLFALSLRYGALFERFERIAKRLLGDDHKLVVLLDGAALDAEIHRLVAQRSRLLVALGWQLAGMAAGAFETWFALRLLGQPVSIGDAVAIEALTQAARHAMFFVPAGLGVQEATVMLLGRLLGVGDGVGLSLALVKRMREVLFGAAALLSWQWIEARSLRRGWQRQRQQAETEA